MVILAIVGLIKLWNPFRFIEERALISTLIRKWFGNNLYFGFNFNKYILNSKIFC